MVIFDPLLLDDYVTDEDTELEDLFWFASVSGTDNILVGIDPVSHNLVVMGMNNWSGLTNFSLIVSDGQNLDMGIITVEVNPINDPPQISPMTSIAFMEDEGYNFPAHDFIHDPDTELSSLVIEISGNTMVHTEFMDSSNSVIQFSAEADWSGQESLTMSVSDGEFTESVSFMVAVVPVNDPPVFTSLTYPIDGEEIENSDVTFVWEPASDVDINDLLTYHFSVYSDEEMNDMVTEVSGEEMLETMVTLESGTYYWLVVVSDSEGETSDSEVRSFTLSLNLSVDSDQLPDNFVLHQNYPNPFNPTTEIRYDLAEDAFVTINIYDLMGRTMKTLVSDNQTAGYRRVHWDATNNVGETVSAGMYIYIIQAGEFSQTRKMVLLK